MKKYTTIKQVKTVEVNTRHWTDSFGNTYFAGELFVNDKNVVSEDFCYGYGGHALMEIVNKAVKLGELPRKKQNEVTWRYLDRIAGRKKWNHSDTQVNRKKDM